MADSLLKQALHHQKHGEYATSEKFYRQLLSREPDNIAALYYLGILKQQQGCFDEAIALLSKVQANTNRDVDVAYNLGVAYFSVGNKIEARAQFERTVSYNANHALAWNNLGVLYLEKKQYEKALHAFDHAIVANPEYADACNNKAQVFLELKKYEEALHWAEQALAHDKSSAIAWFTYGNALRYLESLSEAENAYLRTIELDPNQLDARYNLALVYRQRRDWDSAEHVYRELIQIAPHYTDAYNGLVKMLYAQDRFNEADEMLRRVAPQKGHEKLFNDLAITELLLGKYHDAWAHYLKRNVGFPVESTAGKYPAFDVLRNKQIALYGEQGLGDELFFLRFLPALWESGVSAVHYVTDSKLHELLGQQNLFTSVTDKPENIPAVDFHVRLGDLPYLLEAQEIDTGKTPPLRLSVNAANRPEIPEAIIQPGTKPLLGLTWRAGINDSQSLFKTFPFSDLLSLLDKLDVRIVILQRQPTPDEITRLSKLFPDCIDASGCNDDLNSMLALLSCLDDYLCVSNTNLHVWAGLGKPAQVLVPHPPEWRWLATGEHSPWFPHFNLYRQTGSGEWTTAANRLLQHFADKGWLKP